MEQEIFKDTKVDFNKLIEFGFAEANGRYTYSAPVGENQFLLKIVVDQNGKLSTEMLDKSSGDEYVLHLVEGATGSFVGKIRKEYEEILQNIKKNCFEKNIFKSKQAHEVILYIKEKYGSELEFLWPKFPNNAIWRRNDNNKWYGALLTVSANKLNLESDEVIEILDLRAESQRISEIVDNEKIFQGYHMNKNHWITIILNNSLPNDALFALIDKSFDLAKK